MPELPCVSEQGWGCPVPSRAPGVYGFFLMLGAPVGSPPTPTPTALIPALPCRSVLCMGEHSGKLCGRGRLSLVKPCLGPGTFQ